MRWLLLAFVLGCCATVEPPHTRESERTARWQHASTHNPCMPGARVAADCIDNEALVWSACAWNSCGVDPVCRKDGQTKVAAGSCGLDEWPPCKAP